MNRGIVYLVGAGPGDPGLITVRGLECIRRADVIVHDRLASAEFLQEAKPGAEKVFVGKSPQCHALAQAEINDVLVQRAREGKVVTRLKGGDPFLFGRGGEEAEALAEAGVPFEIVPGVTAAIAVPAYAGIPVTHREFASSFAVVTGHEDPSKEESRIYWDKIATGIDTIVFLMGMENLPGIVEQMVEGGRSPQTPVALIRWGTLPYQESVFGTLTDIVDKSRQARFQAPVVVVVGEVVRLGERLRWFDTRPLFGRRVLVTRTQEQASHLSALIREMGGQPIELPLIRIEPPMDFALLDKAISELSGYHWVIFTSVHGVSFFAGRLFSLGQDARSFGSSRICAIGPATARELEKYGLRADFQPARYVAEAIVEGLGDMEGQRVLLPRSDLAREALAIGLREKGAQTDEVVAYRTLTVDHNGPLRSMLENKEIDIVTFTSSSTVKGFVAALGSGDGDKQSLPPGLTIACIGPITARTALEMGLRVDVVAKEHTIPGLVRALVGSLQEKPSASAP